MVLKRASTIPESVWMRVREDWASCQDTIAIIAARHGMAAATLSRRARAEGWPQRGANRSAEIAHQLYADITDELRLSLKALRAHRTDEAPAAAAQRSALIRAHRRALFALLDARKPLPDETRKTSKAGATAEEGDAVPPLDLAAARHDILDRLSRLDRAPPPAKPPSS